MRRSPVIILLLVVALVTLRRGHERPVEIDSIAPDVSARFINQEGRFQLEEKRGKVILLDFWATWCPPCRRTLPGLDLLAKRYQGDPEVEVLSVNCDEGGIGRGRSYLMRAGLSLPTLYDGARRLLQGAFNISGLPSTIIIDRAGRISYAQTGLPPLSTERLVEYLAARIEAARRRPGGDGGS